MKKETQRLLIGLIVGAVITTSIFLIWYYSQAILSTCNSGTNYQTLIGEVCSKENKNEMSFTVDTSNIILAYVNSYSCYNAYKDKFGTYPSGGCLLASVVANGEKAGFIHEYSCWCWN